MSEVDDVPQHSERDEEFVRDREPLRFAGALAVYLLIGCLPVGAATLGAGYSVVWMLMNFGAARLVPSLSLVSTALPMILVVTSLGTTVTLLVLVYRWLGGTWSGRFIGYVLPFHLFAFGVGAIVVCARGAPELLRAPVVQTLDSPDGRQRAYLVDHDWVCDWEVFVADDLSPSAQSTHYEECGCDYTRPAAHVVWSNAKPTLVADDGSLYSCPGHSSCGCDQATPTVVTAGAIGLLATLALLRRRPRSSVVT